MRCGGTLPATGFGSQGFHTFSQRNQIKAEYDMSCCLVLSFSQFFLEISAAMAGYSLAASSIFASVSGSPPFS